MAAIISDNLRILNAKNFLAGVSTSDNSYYAYVGLPNPTDYDTSWETSPPSPMESFNQLNNFWDTAIAMKKISSDDWIRIMDEAHALGIPSSATMMYGHVENKNDIVEHFFKLVKLQEKTKGFMAFIPWNFEPNNTLMKEEGIVEIGTGGIQLLKMIAISRLVLDGLIPHIQSSWLTNGVGMAQLALQYGADDFGGTLIGEEVVSCTGARSTELTDKIIVDAIHQIGYQVEERDNFYNPIRTL